MKSYLNFSIFISVIMLIFSGLIKSVAQTEIKSGLNSLSIEKEIKIITKENYLLYIPEDYFTLQKKWPLILFLHGSGESGNDLTKVLVHGPPKLISEDNRDFPFIIVSPQCPEDDWWGSKIQIKVLNGLLDDICSKYNVDKQRIYMTGLSMGGYGTWSLAAVYPNRFAAIAPICGGGNPEDVEKIAHLPIWVFHGAKDDAVPIKMSEDMVDALKKAGSQVKFTIYPDSGHDSWTVTYENLELYEWFLEHTNSQNE